MSYTNEEYFKLHGTLTPERIEELLDIEIQLDRLEALTDRITHAHIFSDEIPDHLITAVEEVNDTLASIQNVINKIEELRS